MCLICIEFNQRRDLVDAKRMIEAARREADAISPEHLKKLEEALDKMPHEGVPPELDPSVLADI